MRSFEVEYPVPAEVVKSKQKVTVKFQATKGNEIGAVFGIRMIRVGSSTSLQSSDDDAVQPVPAGVRERGNGVNRSCSQGALMRAPDGSWWHTHQWIQNIPTPFQGRTQCLEPVTWTDG